MTEPSELVIRRIVQEETTPQFAAIDRKFDAIHEGIALLRTDLRDVESALNDKMDMMLTKMDGFLKGLGDEKDERLFADAQLERRVERLEGEVLPGKKR